MGIFQIATLIFGVLSLGLGALVIWQFLQGQRLKDEKRLAEGEAQLLKNQIERERERGDQIKTEIRDSFSSLAAQSLQSSTKHLLDMAEATFKKQSQVQEMTLDQKRKSLEQMMEPLSKALGDYQKQVGELEKERQRAFGSIDSELKRVAEMGQQLSKETTALKDALKKPHIRGRWGEVQLKNCIEMAGMSEYADVEFQHVTDYEGDRLIPDMVVRMPEGRRVIVDAKTPLEAFISALEATTEEQRVIEMARHGRHIKEHVKKLSAKSYTEGVEGSADFMVMFLPNESFLYAALETEPDLVEYALQKRILIATPPTLIGLLKVIRFGWSEKKLAENAERISQVGVEMHKRIVDFFKSYESIGKHLERATAEYDKGRTHLQSRILVSAKRLETLGAKSSKSLPESLDQVEESTEDLSMEEGGGTEPTSDSEEQIQLTEPKPRRRKSKLRVTEGESVILSEAKDPLDISTEAQQEDASP